MLVCFHLISGDISGAKVENLPKDETEEQSGNRTHNSRCTAVFSIENENQGGKNRHTLDCSAKNPFCHDVNPGNQGKYNPASHMPVEIN